MNNNSQNNSNKNNSLLKETIEFIRDLVIIFVIVLIIRTFFVLPFQISGQSMYENYYDRQFILVDRFSYLNIPFFWPLTEPKRWDVIVFKTNIEWKEYFIKRIIWLPWETIKFFEWKVFIKENNSKDFVLLDESWYLSSSNNNATYIRWDEWEYIYEIPENSYFVLGDNRNASTDSRTCFSSCSIEWQSNFISREDIIWKVFLDLWYFSFKEMWFRHPNLGIETKPTFFGTISKYNYE